MGKKMSLFVSFLLIIIGLVKFDTFIYPTLDYFGKYVFVLALNIVPLYFSYEFYKKGYNNLIIIGWGAIVGIVLYLL